jgi:hypothetical protein
VRSRWSGPALLATSWNDLLIAESRRPEGDDVLKC